MNDKIKEAQRLTAERRRAYVNLFYSPNGKVVLEDLDKQFNRTTLRKVDGVIDPNASIAAAGCREVLLYIDEMMRNNNAVD